jgi:DNA-binding beta-propeller fold protein YncE
MTHGIRRHVGTLAFLAILGIGTAPGTLTAQSGLSEVWVTDQSGTAGRLFIYDGYHVHQNAAAAIPEVFQLDPDNNPAAESVGDRCLAQTGSAPTRAHMLAFNATHTHAILSFVASGHVAFIEAATRRPVGCIDVGVQAHAAFASPDNTYVVVANQNGKLLQRIRTNYAANTFTLDEPATINLATCTTPNGRLCQDSAPTQTNVRPDTAPICPAFDSSGRLIFVTLRGGGLFVVDGTSTPMRIISEYDRDTVHPNGCGGLDTRGKMYINAGGGDAANPTEFDVYSFPLSAYPTSGFTAVNTPAPRRIVSKDDGDHDAHGMLLTRRGYLWVADRFANTIDVIDTVTDTLVNTFSLAGAASRDPAPDLMDLYPLADYAFVTLRGPCPLTANAPGVNNAVGATPGLGLVSIDDLGLRGRLQVVAPITNVDAAVATCAPLNAPASNNRADVHGIAVRRIR